MKEKKKQNWIVSLLIVVALAIAVSIGSFFIVKTVYNRMEKRYATERRELNQEIDELNKQLGQTVVEKDFVKKYLQKEIDNRQVKLLMEKIALLDFNPDSPNFTEAEEYMKTPEYFLIKKVSDEYLKESDKNYAYILEERYGEVLEEYADGNTEVAVVLFGYLVNGCDTITDTMDVILAQKWILENPREVQRYLNESGKTSFPSMVQEWGNDN